MNTDEEDLKEIFNPPDPVCSASFTSVLIDSNKFPPHEAPAMIKELSAMMGLMGNKSKIQDEMQKFQAQIPLITAEGFAGGTMVVVKANGKMEIVSCKISAEAMQLQDREMLEDLVMAATNQALGKVREILATETAKMASNMGLPAGMLGSLTGMG